MLAPRFGKETALSRSSMRSSKLSDSMPGLSVVRSNSRRSLINDLMSAPSATMRKVGVISAPDDKSPRTRQGVKGKMAALRAACMEHDRMSYAAKESLGLALRME